MSQESFNSGNSEKKVSYLPPEMKIIGADMPNLKDESIDGLISLLKWYQVAVNDIVNADNESRALTDIRLRMRDTIVDVLKVLYQRRDVNIDSIGLGGNVDGNITEEDRQPLLQILDDALNQADYDRLKYSQDSREWEALTGQIKILQTIKSKAQSV